MDLIIDACCQSYVKMLFEKEACQSAKYRTNYNKFIGIDENKKQKTLVCKTCRYFIPIQSHHRVYTILEDIIFISFHLAVVPLHSFLVVSLSTYIRVYPKRERTGGYSRGSMDEDLAAIFKQTRRHCLESLFSIQHATKKHLAHGFEKLHNYDNQRPHENRGNKKSVTRFSRCFTRTRWLRMSWKVSRELTLLFIHAYILFAFR